MNLIRLGRQDPDSPQQRLLRGVHEGFAQALSSSLSAFLQCDISTSLETIGSMTEADLRRTLETPSSVISFQLDPRPERAILAFDCSTVFGLLELLLGGKPGSGASEKRNLTEVEWALFEEVVRLVVAPLGEAWKTFHPVEFRVLALENDPQLLPGPDPALPFFQLVFKLRFGESSCGFQIGVPQTFFEAATGEPAKSAAEDLPRNIDLLGEAQVELEVFLEGPTLALRDLARLSPGQVVRFDYSLQKPLRAMVNETTPIAGQIVSAGNKRAFQVEALP
jgi:flagellar motor switch protein FliM